MTTMDRSKALEFINSTDGKFFTATFRKKNNERRVMNCRINVKKGVTGKGMAYNPVERGFLPVYEGKNDDFRMLNLNTLEEIVFQGHSVKFVDNKGE